MLYALYNGKIISAEEIAEKESDETPVRRARAVKNSAVSTPNANAKPCFTGTAR